MAAETGSSLDGRVALVVGPGGDTETAIARALADAGCRVVTAGTDDEAGSWSIDHPGARPILDTHDGDPRRLIDAAAVVGGRLDILVQHRPTVRRGLVADLTADDWEADLGQVARTVALATAFARRCEPGAAIVTLVSLDLSQAYPERATASAVSNALVGASRAMAVEWARTPLRVNVVADGPVLAEADRRAVADGERSLDRMLLRAPSHRIGTPDETAAVVRFLVDDRSRFITGQVLWVDGGWAALTQHAEGLRFP